MKITLYMTMSADGYIARHDDSTPWSEAEWLAYADFVRPRGCIIVGRATYDLMVASGELQTIGQPLTIVLSSTRNGSPDARTMFAQTPDEALAVARGQGFTEVVLGGGPATNVAFLAAGLIDDMVIDIESVLLGSGKTMFAGEAVLPRLQLLGSETLSAGIVRLHYQLKTSR